jgi:uncharacterized membrane protein
LIVLNLAYLAFVALVPFTSGLLGHYADETQAVVIYAMNLAATSLLFVAQVRYAYRRDLVDARARAYRRRFAGPAAFVVSGTFIASIPIAFIDPHLCPFIWIVLLLVGGRVADAIAGQRSPY